MLLHFALFFDINSDLRKCLYNSLFVKLANSWGDYIGNGYLVMVIVVTANGDFNLVVNFGSSVRVRASVQFCPDHILLMV